MSVRVRYAPSPTGLQHIGGLRTALFNYLFAQSQNGKFFLRIEDTDQSRYSPEAEKDLYETLTWAGIQWDEGPDKGGNFGPYTQSQRLKLYKEYAYSLIEKDLAYPCFCTTERMEALRKDQESRKEPLGYDRHCRNLSKSEQKAALDRHEKHTIRFKIPLEGTTTIEDGILGPITTAHKEMAVDPVLLKSDGFPTYHLAHVVDDHLMETTHVLRAQEWLPSAPLHIQLFQALGWTPPQYYHLPLILGKDRQKLSKRHGATSVKQFKDDGYLPEAVVNYLALLGWSYDDEKEFFTMEELRKNFDLKRLNKSPAVFDYEKLIHFNAHYLRQKSDADLIQLFMPELIKAGIVAAETPETTATLLKILPLVRERVKFPSEVSGVAKFFFQPINTWNKEDLIPKKLDRFKTIQILEKALILVEDYFQKSELENEEAFHKGAEDLGIKLGDFMMPLRVAVSGSRVSPPMFPSFYILGLETIKQRLQGAKLFLESIKE